MWLLSGSGVVRSGLASGTEGFWCASTAGLKGVRCPACESGAVIRDGCDDTQPCRQRYRCKACSGRFDDLTGTVLAGHHQPLRVWVPCLYFRFCCKFWLRA